MPLHLGCTHNIQFLHWVTQTLVTPPIRSKDTSAVIKAEKPAEMPKELVGLGGTPVAGAELKRWTKRQGNF